MNQHQTLNNEWDVKDTKACFIMFSMMGDDIIFEFECKYTAKGLLVSLQTRFGI